MLHLRISNDNIDVTRFSCDNLNRLIQALLKKISISIGFCLHSTNVALSLLSIEKEKYEALNQELTEKLHNAEIEIKKDRDQLNKEYETLNNKRNSILFKAQNEADRLINEITALKKKLESNDEVSQEALSKIKKKTDNLYESKLIPKKANKHEIKEGDNVRILEYNKIGTVIKIKNNNYSVQIGSLIFNYSIDEIEYEGADVTSRVGMITIMEILLYKKMRAE